MSPPPETIWLCAPVEIVCETNDGTGNQHGIVLQWWDRRGRLHQHVVPRWGGDANFMPVIGHTKVLPQLLAQTRELLAGAW